MKDLAKLDLMDRDALDNWRKNYEYLAKKNNVQRSIESQKADMNKIIELYKIYGNDTTALVNPAENRFVLEVRDRGYEVNRLNDQI